MLILSNKKAVMIVSRKLHLFKRADVAHSRDVIRDCVGIHASRFTSPIISLLARVDFRSVAVAFSEIYDPERIVKIRCMRGTLHHVDVEEAAILHKATFSQRMFVCHYLGKRTGISYSDQRNVQKRIVELLVEGRKSLDQIVLALKGSTRIQSTSFEKMVSISVRMLWEEGRLCALTLPGLWPIERRIYALNTHWLPDVDSDSMEQHEAQSKLISKYIASYGPTTVSDAAWWSGFSRSRIKEFLRERCRDVIMIRLKHLKEDCFMDQKDLDEFQELEVENENVRFLAREDNLLKGYRASRTRFAGTRELSCVYNAGGEALPTILHRGQVIGLWEWNSINGSVTYRTFSNHAGNIAKSIAAEAQRISALLRPYCKVKSILDS